MDDAISPARIRLNANTHQLAKMKSMEMTLAMMGLLRLASLNSLKEDGTSFFFWVDMLESVDEDVELDVGS